MLFNIRPWSESPNQDSTALLHAYWVAERGSSLDAGAITRAVRLGGGGQFSEWVTTMNRMSGVGWRRIIAGSLAATLKQLALVPATCGSLAATAGRRRVSAGNPAPSVAPLAATMEAPVPGAAGVASASPRRGRNIKPVLSEHGQRTWTQPNCPPNAAPANRRCPSALARQVNNERIS